MPESEALAAAGDGDGDTVVVSTQYDAAAAHISARALDDGEVEMLTRIFEQLVANRAGGAATSVYADSSRVPAAECESLAHALGLARGAGDADSASGAEGMSLQQWLAWGERACGQLDGDALEEALGEYQAELVRQGQRSVEAAGLRRKRSVAGMQPLSSFRKDPLPDGWDAGPGRGRRAQPALSLDGQQQLGGGAGVTAAAGAPRVGRKEAGAVLTGMGAIIEPGTSTGTPAVAKDSQAEVEVDGEGEGEAAMEMDDEVAAALDAMEPMDMRALHGGGGSGGGGGTAAKPKRSSVCAVM